MKMPFEEVKTLVAERWLGMMDTDEEGDEEAAELGQELLAAASIHDLANLLDGLKLYEALEFIFDTIVEMPKGKWQIVVRNDDGHIVNVIGGFDSEDACDHRAGELEEVLHRFHVSYEQVEEGGGK